MLQYLSVFSHQINLAKRFSQRFMNFPTLSPTRSSIWLKHPMSMTFGYRIPSECIALPFTAAQSLIQASSFVLVTPSSVLRSAVLACASSSPVTGLANNSSQTRLANSTFLHKVHYDCKRASPCCVVPLAFKLTLD